MAYALAVQVPEEVVKEEWMWKTDVIVSRDGHEDRIPLLRYPRRAFSGQYLFTDLDDVRRQLALMQLRYKTTFLLPLYQHQAKLKAKVAAGSDEIQINAMRTDLREGSVALVIEGTKFELATVAVALADSIAFTTNLLNSYSARAIVCPVVECYAPTGAQVTRRNEDGHATASFRYFELVPVTPFVSPLNTEVLTTFDGMVVLDQPGIGGEFEQTLDTGIILTEGIGRVAIVSPLDQSDWTFSLTWLCNRLFNPASWNRWIKLADALQGSYKTFLISTQRADLKIVTPVAGGGNTVTVNGTEYSEHFWALDTYKRVVVSSDAGRHYAKITAVATIGGHNRLTLSPALPAGAGWNSNQKISFLPKVRIADDKITCDHQGLHTEVSMTLSTVV